MGGHVNYTAFIRPVCLPCVENNCLGSYLQQQGMLTGNETPEERCQIESKLNFGLKAKQDLIKLTISKSKCNVLIVRMGR